MIEKSAYIPAYYQGESWPDTFTTRPLAPDFESRKQVFFDQVLRNPAPPRGSKRAIFEVARLAAGDQPDEGIIHQDLSEFIEGRQDCADFVMQAIIRLLYQFGGQAEDQKSKTETFRQRVLVSGNKSTPSFSTELLAHAKAATLNFKYWPDEPGIDYMCTWTENHQILL